MKFIQDITEFKRNLLDKLGLRADEASISIFVTRWNEAATNYNNYPKLRKKFEHQIKTIDKTIEELKHTINILRKTNFETGDDNLPSPDLFPVKQTIHIIEGKIIYENIYRHYAVYEKDALKSTDSQMTTGIIEIFKLGESMKLNIKGKLGAGRGNKNKIFELFETIAGISDKDTFLYYRGVYTKSKTTAGAIKRIKPFVINGLEIVTLAAEYKHHHQNTPLR